MSVSSAPTLSTTASMRKRSDLLRQPVRPIHSEEDYDAALAEIDSLGDPEPGTPEGDRFDVLVTLVIAYEQEHYPIGPSEPIPAILYHLESRGLTRKDLEPYIGSRARVAEVLNKKRPLSLAMIRKLNQGLGLPLDVLARPYDLST
jgi:HTH-type transcriptional regulator / antitoxin HigA